MKTLYTLAALLAATSLSAQFTLQAVCPDPVTVACIEEIPEADISLVAVETDCDVDFDGNPIDTSTTTGGGGGGVTVTCDTVTAGCYTITSGDVDTLNNGDLKVCVEITYNDEDGCKHAVSHVAFSLPEGVAAVDFNSSDTYVGELGDYHVENTTNNPYHSIKFESNSDGFSPGATETFCFTLPAGTAYEEVTIKIKAGRVIDQTTLALGCTTTGDNGGGGAAPDTTVNYTVRWLFDYVIPGGSGCIGDPIILSRTYSVSDACFNSSECFQDYLIESECINGVPVGCAGDTSSMGRAIIDNDMTWSQEDQSYGVEFTAYTERPGGRYRIKKSKRENGGESVEDDQLLGFIAPGGEESYFFVHESIGAGDSIVVEWLGEIEESSSTSTPEVQRAEIFPNPGTDGFSVRIPAPAVGGIQLQVYDQMGRLIHEDLRQNNSQEVYLSTANWQPGIYLVKIVDGQNQAYQSRWVRR